MHTIYCIVCVWWRWRSNIVHLSWCSSKFKKERNSLLIYVFTYEGGYYKYYWRIFLVWNKLVETVAKIYSRLTRMLVSSKKAGMFSSEPRKAYLSLNLPYVIIHGKCGVCIVAIDLLYIGYDDDDEHDNHSSFLPIQWFLLFWFKWSTYLFSQSFIHSKGIVCYVSSQIVIHGIAIASLPCHSSCYFFSETTNK